MRTNETHYDRLLRQVQKLGGSVVDGPEQLSRREVRLVCAKGHAWMGDIFAVIDGSWCAVCYSDKRRVANFESLKEAVARQGGTLLTPLENYVNLEGIASVRCERGHDRNYRAKNLKIAYRCRECWLDQKKLGPFEKARAFADKSGFKIQSKVPLGTQARYVVICPVGHQFRRQLASLFAGGFWCPDCFASTSEAHVLERMRDAARAKGGSMASKKFLGWEAKLEFVCEKKHRWSCKPQNVLNGAWCKRCFTERQSIGLAELQAEARRRKGHCLSKTYLGVPKAYDWECGAGHRFRISYISVRKGAWCGRCQPGKTTKRSIEQMAELAKSHGGRCVSRVYRDSKTPLLWQCREGHCWQSKPNDVQQGHWCPVCAVDARRRGQVQAVRARSGEEI